MKQDIIIAVYLVLMGAIIVATDVLFLRDHFWARLGTNVGIVVLFAAVYLLFLRNLLK
ncbi:MAG: hypothetical protein LCH36_13930 [Actinobacteria bacterium]|jgi:hypothetical protein|nr:hypothetical protein [Actinomycetota bacterium]